MFVCTSVEIKEELLSNDEDISNEEALCSADDIQVALKSLYYK